jgi:transposase
MKHNLPQNVGVDISKDRLDVAQHPARRTAQFPNDAQGHQALIAWLADVAVARITLRPPAPITACSSARSPKRDRP